MSSLLLKVLIILVIFQIDSLFCMKANIFINGTTTKYIVGFNKAVTIKKFSFNLLSNFESTFHKDLSKNLVLYWAKNFTNNWIYMTYSSKSYDTVKRCNVEHYRSLYREGKEGSSKFMMSFPIDDILRERFRCDINKTGFYGKMYFLNLTYDQSYGQVFLPKYSTAYFVISSHLSYLKNVDEFESFRKSCQEYHENHIIFIILSALIFVLICYLILLIYDYFHSFVNFIVQFIYRNRVVLFTS